MRHPLQTPFITGLGVGLRRDSQGSVLSSLRQASLLVWSQALFSYGFLIED